MYVTNIALRHLQKIRGEMRKRDVEMTDILREHEEFEDQRLIRRLEMEKAKTAVEAGTQLERPNQSLSALRISIAYDE